MTLEAALNGNGNGNSNGNYNPPAPPPAIPLPLGALRPAVKRARSSVANKHNNNNNNDNNNNNSHINNSSLALAGADALVELAELAAKHNSAAPTHKHNSAKRVRIGGPAFDVRDTSRPTAFSAPVPPPPPSFRPPPPPPPPTRGVPRAPPPPVVNANANINNNNGIGSLFFLNQQANRTQTHNDMISPTRGSKSVAWSRAEEERLVALVELEGQKRWAVIAASMPGRTGKQCRERWLNHLRPDIRRGGWSEEEELTLAKGHLELGTRWSALAQRLPGRTENAIKNRWNATLRCKGRVRTSPNAATAAAAAANNNNNNNGSEWEGGTCSLLKRYVDAWSEGGDKAAKQVVDAESKRMAKLGAAYAATKMPDVSGATTNEEEQENSASGTNCSLGGDDDGDDTTAALTSAKPAPSNTVGTMSYLPAVAASEPIVKLATPITYQQLNGDLVSIEPHAPDAAKHLAAAERAGGPGASTMLLSSGAGGPGVTPAHAHMAAEQGLALCSTIRLRWPGLRACRVIARAGPPQSDSDPAILIVVSSENWRTSTESLAFAAEALSFQPATQHVVATPRPRAAA